MKLYIDALTVKSICNMRTSGRADLAEMFLRQLRTGDACISIEKIDKPNAGTDPRLRTPRRLL
jgi:hypothetical protein